MGKPQQAGDETGVEDSKTSLTVHLSSSVQGAGIMVGGFERRVLSSLFGGPGSAHGHETSFDHPNWTGSDIPAEASSDGRVQPREPFIPLLLTIAVIVEELPSCVVYGHIDRPGRNVTKHHGPHTAIEA